MKNIIVSFLPWILFFILTGPTQAQLDVAIVASMIASLLCGIKELKKGFLLAWGTLLFFIFMLVSVVLFKISWIVNHAWLFSNGTLAFIAWISLLIGKPFTLQYAREQVSKDKWQHPIFIRINQLLTAAWGSIFLLNIIIHFFGIYFTQLPHWLYETFSVGLTILGIWFTKWFPQWYRQKAVGDK